MNYDIIYILLESLLIVLALSSDAFIASLAYGSNNIKIPWTPALIVSIICTGILGISLFSGILLKGLIPQNMLKYLSFFILIILGLSKLMDNMVKTLISKYTVINKKIKFTMFNLHFILNVYANPNEADLDESKTISSKESLSLALALSIDSLGAGFGAAMDSINIPALLILSLALTVISIKSGEFLGKKIKNKFPYVSWLGGIFLIIVAILRII